MAEAFEIQARSDAVLSRWSLPASTVDGPLAQVARSVARAQGPITAAAIRRQVPELSPAEVRAVLATPVFVRTGKGWMLGRLVDEPSEAM